MRIQQRTEGQTSARNLLGWAMLLVCFAIPWSAAAQERPEGFKPGLFAGVAIGQDVMSSSFHVLQEAVLGGTVLAENRNIYATAGWRFSDKWSLDATLDYQSRSSHLVLAGAVFEENLRYLGLGIHGNYFFGPAGATFAPFAGAGLFLGIPGASTAITNSPGAGNFRSSLASAVEGLWLTGLSANGGMEWRATDRIALMARFGLQYVHFSTVYQEFDISSVGFAASIPASYSGSSVGLETQIVMSLRL